MDHIRNTGIREGYRNRRSLLERVDQSILKCCGYIKKVDGRRFTKRVGGSEWGMSER